MPYGCWLPGLVTAGLHHAIPQVGPPMGFVEAMSADERGTHAGDAWLTG